MPLKWSEVPGARFTTTITLSGGSSFPQGMKGTMSLSGSPRITLGATADVNVGSDGSDRTQTQSTDCSTVVFTVVSIVVLQLFYSDLRIYSINRAYLS
jgi:hypothetical protein